MPDDKTGGHDPHLRDFFAGLAMLGLVQVDKLSSRAKHDEYVMLHNVARRAYELADLMLKERTNDDTIHN